MCKENKDAHGNNGNNETSKTVGSLSLVKEAMFRHLGDQYKKNTGNDTKPIYNSNQLKVISRKKRDT